MFTNKVCFNILMSDPTQLESTPKPVESLQLVEGAEAARQNMAAIWKAFDETFMDSGEMTHGRELMFGRGSNGWGFYRTETTPDVLVLDKKVEGNRHDVFSSRITLIRRNQDYVQLVDVSSLPLNEEALADNYRADRSNFTRRALGQAVTPLRTGIRLEVDIKGKGIKDPEVVRAIPQRRPSNELGNMPYEVMCGPDELMFDPSYFEQLSKGLAEAAQDVQQIATQVK